MRILIISLVVTIVLIIVVFLAFGEFEAQTTRWLEGVMKNKGQYSLYSFLILSSDVVLPIPSSVVMVLNGFVLGPVLGSLLSLISLMLTAIIGYYIGKGGRSWGSTQESVQLIGRYGVYAVLLTRGIPILSESICLVCGLNQMDFQKYLWVNLIGYLPLCILYALLGHLGKAGDAFITVVLLSVAVTILFWIFGRKLNQ